MKRLVLLAAGMLLLTACTPKTNISQPATDSAAASSQLSNASQAPTTIQIPAMPELTQPSTEQLLNLQPGQKLTATIHTSEGDIPIELFHQQAPETVANFVGLAEGTKQWVDPSTGKVVTERSLYQGTVFHRVIKNFMLQGGDPLGNGTGGPGYRFKDEFDPTLVFDGPGILAMANAGPGTNGSQFFITHAATPHLNGAHTIFGKVTIGMEVVDKIANTPTAPNDRPLEEVMIEEVVIERQ
jgi:peptidyl-prolyl cis-trans isomerase A (cyclophilin A)